MHSRFSTCSSLCSLSRHFRSSESVRLSLGDATDAFSSILLDANVAVLEEGGKIISKNISKTKTSKYYNTWFRQQNMMCNTKQAGYELFPCRIHWLKCLRKVLNSHRVNTALCHTLAADPLPNITLGKVSSTTQRWTKMALLYVRKTQVTHAHQFVGG